ncbi:MAG TPA: TatD family hydrolase [Bacteroidales bacterium]|nr:TatD family hydrolase [Bacteroidales bacterium]
MRFIDTHSHLYLPEFDNDRRDAVQRAIDSGVNKILLPNIDSSSIQAMNQMTTEYPGICHSMIGLHPTSVKEDYKKELEIVERELRSGTYCAIGEIGIDLYWDKTFLPQQKKALRIQFEWSLAYNLPVVIHARNSFAEILSVLEIFKGKGLKGIFHAFSGDVETAKAVTSQGFLLGVGGMITYKNSLLPKVIKEMPVECLVLETDSPYLSPVPYRGKRNESSYIPVIAQVIHDIKNIPLEEVASVTTNNAERLFRISD